MPLTMKKNRLLIGLASLTLLGSFLFISPNKGTKVSYAEDAPQIAEPGMVAYAADYSSDIKDEPKYATQNSTTFQYLNLGSTLDQYRGDSVKVGIIDSGINYDHEDFMVSGSTKVKGDSKYYAYQTSSWVYYKASQHGYSYIDDTLGHGTNVAATVAAAVNSIGGLGLAPNVELYVYKVTNSSNGYEFGAIQNALLDAKTLGLDVINMSFQSYEHAVSYGSSSMAASSGCSTILSNYLNQAYNAGITLVGAAGNYNTDEPSYPGSNANVINVGSLNSSGTDKAGFSNYGSTIDLVAPGYVYVADEASNTAYTNTQGTSFSAPLVTAAIALYKQKNPSATPAQIESALYASCDAIDDSGSAYTNWAGHGSLNVARFLGVQEDSPTEIVVNNPEVVNDQLELEIGDTFDLDWTVNGVGTFDDSVNFYTYDEGIISVDQNGHIIATGVGNDYVIIESNADSNVYAGIYVTVNSSGGSTPTVTSVSVNPSQLSLDLNGTKAGTLTVTVYGTNNPSQNVTWSSSNDSIATVSNTGSVTAKAAGTVTITATSDVDNTKSGTCSVTVSDSTVHVTGVSLNKNSTTISVGSTETLTATVSPNNATNKSITWTTSNSSIATVNSTGVVSGVAAGTATITVRTVDGSYTATCTVTVQAAQTQTLTITMSSFDSATASYAWYGWSGNTTESKEVEGYGELYKPDSSKMQFNKSKGQKVAAVYNTSAIPGSITKIEATSAQTTIRSWTAYVCSTACSHSGSTLTFGSNKTTVGTVSPAVGTSTSFGTSNAGYSYFCLQLNDSSASFISEFKITYVPKAISSISVKTAPTKTTYEVGDNFDPTGLVITATYSDSTTADISYASASSQFTFNPTTSTALTTDHTSVSITYGGKTTSQAITVTAAKTLSSITISGYSTSFVEGDTFSFGGTVTAHYSDSSSDNVTSSATFSGYNMTTLGNQTVTVSYTYKNTSKTATYSINVGQGTLSSISVSGQTTSYIKNHSFAFDGTCTATFANGYQKVVTPTSVSSPDMTTAGNKNVTVSFTYNGITKSTSYSITVNSNRTVIETTSISGTITWPTSATPTISGSLTNLTCSASGKTVHESSSIRLGTSNGGGTLTINCSNTITSLTISAKYYSSSYSSAVLKVDGQSVTPLSADYSDYNVTLTSGKTLFTILTENSNSRVNIQSITLYSESETDISTSEDCVGLESFIDTYMHMDYVENLGYCKDDQHHYYSTAKTAFNNLNQHQRLLFTSNVAYTSEWTRLSTWASFNGDSLNGSNILAAGQNINPISTLTEVSTPMIIVVIVSIVSAISIGGYFYLSKRKEHM